MGDDVGHVSHGLCPSLPEDHPGPSLEVLGVLDEAESAGGLVSRPQVFLVHGHDGCRLTSTATVH